MASGIYMIKCLSSGKFYVGSAKNIEGRWKQHKRQLRKSTHKNRYLQNAWAKHGEGAFSFEVVQHVDDINNLIAAEQVILDRMRPYDRTIGFNICEVANSSLGVKRSLETRAKVSLATKGRVASPETRQLMSASRTGKKKGPRSADAIKKTSDAIRGRKHSNETKEKMSMSRQSVSKETREKLSTAAREQWERTRSNRDANRDTATEEQIRAALLDRRLSVVSERTGLGINTLRRFLHGEGIPRQATLTVLSIYLEVSNGQI